MLKLKENCTAIITFIFMAVFFYFPLLSIFIKTFSSANLGTNFVDLWHDEYQKGIIIFTFTQAFLSTLGTLLLGLPGAYYFSKERFGSRRILSALTAVPFVLPSMVVALGFILLWGNNGYVNRFLAHFGLKIKFLYGFSTIIAAHVFYNFSLVTRIVGAGWANIDNNLLKSAKTLGANRLQAFLRVELPLLLPSIANASILVFSYCFMSFGIVLSLGSVKYTTIEVSIYYLARYLLLPEKAMLLAIVQVAFSFLLLFATNSANRWYERNKIYAQPNQSVQKNKAGIFLRRFYFSVTVILLVCPLVAIFAKIMNFEMDYFSYDPLLGTSPWGVIGNSLKLASLVSILSTCLSVSYAWKKFPGQDAYIYLPLSISAITYGMGYYFFRGIPDFLLLTAAQTVLTLPLNYKVIAGSLQSYNPHLSDAAKTLGANSFQIFLRVMLPYLRPAIYSSTLFSFAISMGDVATGAMLGSYYTTLPVAMYRYMSNYRFYQAGHLAIILILTSALVFYFSETLFKDNP